VASPSGVNKISGNVLTPEGTQLEKTLLVLTMDESGGCCRGAAAGCSLRRSL